MKAASLVVGLLLSCQFLGNVAFQPLREARPRSGATVRLAHLPQRPFTATTNKGYQRKGVLVQGDEVGGSITGTFDAISRQQQTAAAIAAMALIGIPTPALATAGPVPSAILAWLHFIGMVGVAGGLISERFLLKKNMSQEDEIKINNADGVYGLSAFSLLISGYFRATDFAKGWDFYRNEPIFWLKMSSVAVLGGLSFFPAIVFFRRDQARQKGQTLAPLSDDLVDRLSTIINAEILALLTIPLFATLMARGVLYVDNFFWPAGVALYALSLGGAGFKYGKEAFDMMESEQALVPISGKETTTES